MAINQDDDCEWNFRIYLDEKLIFTEKYTRRLGDLLGVSYQFFGTGKIDYLEMKDSAGVTFYRNEFMNTVHLIK